MHQNLNTQKIIFKSEEEIREYSRNFIISVLENHSEQHDEGSSAPCSNEGCGFRDIDWIKLACKMKGVDAVIEDYAKLIILTKELDPNVSPSTKTNILSLTSLGEGPTTSNVVSTAVKYLKVNFIMNTGFAVDTLSIISTLNKYFSDTRVNTTLYGNRKKLDTKIRFQRAHKKTLTGDKILTFTSKSDLQSQVLDSVALANSFGFKQNHINIYFANFSEGQDFGAYAYYPYAYPYTGTIIWPTYTSVDVLNNPGVAHLSIHEMGHVFGLAHTFGPNCGAGTEHLCDCTDDAVSDTPKTKINSGNTRTNECEDGPSMNENWMDYSLVDPLGDHFFTIGQSARIDAAINTHFSSHVRNTTEYSYPASSNLGLSPNFSCVKTKSVEIKKNYLGQNINFQDTITTQLEIFFINENNDDSLNAWLSQINSYFNIGSFLPALTIHGITFSNCRITSIDFPTSPDFNSNAISRGSLTLTIEEKIAGDLSNIINNSIYTDSNTGNQLGALIDSNAAYIDDISEDFNYSIGLNGQYNVTHTVNVAPNDSSGTLQKDLGLTIAKSLIDGYLPSSSFSSNSSIHSALRLAGVVGTLSASLNQITGEASYTRTINLLSNRSANFDSSFEHSHSLVLDKEGIITITESGKILPIEKDTSTDYTNAVSLLPSILSAARNRCVNVFSNYISKFNSTFAGVATVNPLGNTAIETSKNFNEINQEISYSASYSNNPNVLNGHTIDRTIDISKDSRGIANISEKTSFISHQSKCSFSDPFELFNVLFLPDVSYAFNRIYSVWNDFNAGGVLDGGITYAFKLASRDVSFSPNGKSLNYSISYTSDKSISSVGSFAKNAGISKMSMDVSDKIPERIKQEFPIVSVGMLVHDVDQTSLGSRTVSLSVNLDRNSSYGLNNPTLPTSALNYLANIARIKLLRVYQDLGFVPYPLPPKPTDIFIIECSYNFTSKRSLSFNVTAQYVQPR